MTPERRALLAEKLSKIEPTEFELGFAEFCIDEWETAISSVSRGYARSWQGQQNWRGHFVFLQEYIDPAREADCRTGLEVMLANSIIAGFRRGLNEGAVHG